MARTDRLLSLIEILRDGRLHRAEDLGARLGVSIRTIYRDMETLAASGVPIEGERGLGYTAQAAITLPPLNLTEEEMGALHLGLAVVAQSGDEELRTAAKALAAKVEAVLPEDRSTTALAQSFATGAFAAAAQAFRHIPAFRAAIRSRQKLRARMEDGREETIRPLKIDYWGRVWSGIAWGEETGDFLTLRIDRIAGLTVLPGLFVDEPGKRLDDYTATASERHE
ncbi:Predicted DNA-binding transcriptional regulator YafY, contains an HTH and WYL domains [Poseidonocella pacifica]|uniref:Predicted DNA-binding transcriptional regulator YafY, contains an HTH and WYL domains n=1 Tax=Poseidonocella pacifica TaxID=871651 RepID=A0A1I0V7P7_9RHOB|nr:YafY family protein [Poseidonocella pacifica]SFA72414.1 Predicted DNA-binding transcriptional regulator YafY, contains an HTH and WYL domains [Poseidonocella pacifica]